MNAPQGSDRIHLFELWRTLWSSRVTIAAFTAGMAVLSIGIALVIPPKYRAEVVLSEVQDQNMAGAGGLAGQLGGLASLVGMNIGGLGSNSREALAVLRSRAMVEEFIRRNDLLPVLFEGDDPNQRGSLWLGTLKFQEGILQIQQDTRSQLITVAVTWDDPVVAARWANDFVALANQVMRSRALNSAERNIAFLRKQVQETDVVELQGVLYKLIESEAKTLMLANVREEYSFVVVDPAVAPEFRHSPKRTLLVVFGTLLGGFMGVMYAFVVDLLRRERQGTL